MNRWGSLFILTLLISFVVSTFHVQTVIGISTVYIKADGSINPSDAPISTGDNVTYTFTGNITSDADGIVVERDNIVIDGAGYTATGSGGGKGIMLADRRNVTVRNMTIKNFDYGIFLDSSSDNTLLGNNANNNIFGIALPFSSNCSLFGNNVTANNQWGIGLGSSSDNTLFGNNVTANKLVGVYLDASSDNKFCHNTFVANTQQVFVRTNTASSVNVWDDGYPSSGNYWSNYTGTDLYSGTHQNETGGDGICDQPYVIDENNTDRYPLMDPYATILGDINHDRIVDIYDAILLASAFGGMPGSSNWNSAADINSDNIVDIYDAITLANNFGKTA